MDETERFMKNLRSLIKEDDAKKKPRKKSKVKAYTKPESIIALQEDYFRWRLAQGEDCSQPRKSTFSDENANELTRAVVAHIYCNGGFAGRVNTMGTYRGNGYTTTTARKGMADINACIKGKHVQIEVKIGSDKPREAQLEVKKDVEAAGGTYIFVKTFDDYLKKIKPIF